MSMTDSENARAWLAQFEVDDQREAAALLDAMALVSADELSVGLRAQILAQPRSASGPVALGICAGEGVRVWTVSR